MKAVAVPFDELDARTAYDVWRLRQQVFVLEQQCLYGDLDGRDPEPATRHVVLEDAGEVLGYARVLDEGDVWRIGRVVLDQAARGRGLADVLMHTALRSAPAATSYSRPRRLWPTGTRRSASRSTARSTWMTGSRMCRCGGRRGVSSAGR